MRTPFSRIKWDRLSAFPWYPVLIAAYAPIALLANNLGQVEYRDSYRSILITVAAAFVLLFVARLVLRDWLRAGIATAVLIVLFVTYGHVYTAIKNYEISGVLVGRHRYLLVVWLALAVLGLWWSARRSFHFPRSLSSTMNIVSIVLLLYPSFRIVSYALSSQVPQEPIVMADGARTTQHDVSLPDGLNPPDVYYIILDGYGRSDVLLKDVNYDNSAFLDTLRQMGFYVVDCAQSNYSKTDLSLSSSMNLNYVPALGEGFSPESTDRHPLWNLIKNNEVKAVFESLGYTTVAFDTGYDFTEVESSDVYYFAPGRGFNGLENLYLKTTLAAVLDDAGLLRKLQLTPEDHKRELIQFKLKELKKIPASLSGPKFIFAHLVIPHQPFVFGPNGEPLVIPERVYKGQTYYPPKDYAIGYRNQAVYISQKILEVIQVILEESNQPPVIILQGDHGPSHFTESDRMAILNAFYFPGQESRLYTDITPVNSFRLMFNSYFNAGFDLLEDVSYYSEYPYAYQFQEMPNTCQTGVR
jgi:hypothetical protein